jgi:hypothetical protein
MKGEERGFSSPVRRYNVVVVSLEVCHLSDSLLDRTLPAPRRYTMSAKLLAEKETEEGEGVVRSWFRSVV